MSYKKQYLAILLSTASAAHAGEINIAKVAVTSEATIIGYPVIEEIHVDSFSSVSAVVTEDQLRDQNAVDLASALRRTPGVQISRYNPVGAYGGDQGGAVFIRGLGVSRPGSEIKTYVDGIPFYVGVWGHPALDILPVNGMDSITVYKSPQPQINGNNFASINLQSRRATENGIHGDGRLSAGSFGTLVEQANIVGREGAIDFMLAQGYARSNGHRDHADGELKNAMGRIEFQFNPQWKADASFVYANNVVSDPGDSRVAAPAITPEYKSRASMFTASFSHEHESWQGEFRLYSNQGDSNLYNDTVWGTFLTEFDMSGLRWKEEFLPWAGGVVTAGVDIDRISGEVAGPLTGGLVEMPNFRVTSPHLAVAHTVNISENWALIPSAGFRYYDHNQYESKTAPHAGLSLISDKVTLFANASRGINYPGLEGPALQAALPFMFAGTTWQQLSPEEINHGEVGVKLSPTNQTQIDISLFRDNIKNRYVYDLAFGATTYYNTGRYHTNGAELAIKQQIGHDWVVFGGVTLLDPSISNLPYTPKKALTAGLNGVVGVVNVVIDAQYQDEVLALNRDRNTLNPNTQKVGSYTVVNARLSYPLKALGKKGEVFLAVENLFNEDYEYRLGYAMPKISGQIGLSASF